MRGRNESPDFRRGHGFDVANRINLMPDLLRVGYAIREVRVVDRQNRRVSGFPAAAFARVARSGFTSLPRGDLSRPRTTP